MRRMRQMQRPNSQCDAVCKMMLPPSKVHCGVRAGVDYCVLGCIMVWSCTRNERRSPNGASGGARSGVGGFSSTQLEMSRRRAW